MLRDCFESSPEEFALKFEWRGFSGEPSSASFSAGARVLADAMFVEAEFVEQAGFRQDGQALEQSPRAWWSCTSGCEAMLCPGTSTSGPCGWRWHATTARTTRGGASRDERARTREPLLASHDHVGP